jgi:hypothetical protein
MNRTIMMTDIVRPSALWESLRALVTEDGGVPGRWAEALADGEEAVRIFRRLHAVNPTAFRVQLSAALSNLAQTMWRAGRRAETRAVSEEAEALVRSAPGAGQGTGLSEPRAFVPMRERSEDR